MSTRLRPRWSSLVCFLVFCGANANVVAVRAFTPAPLFPAAQLSLHVLPNGVRSVVKTTPGSGIVAVQVWVRAGSRHEFADQGGAAHLLGTACLAASRDFPLEKGGATTAVRALGGNAFVQTSRDSTNFGATVAALFAPDALRILADAVLRPDLSLRALNEAKNIAMGDIRARQADTLSVASDLSYGAAFRVHPYSRSPLGQSGDLNALSSDKLKTFARARYSGANISVVVVGDIESERAQQLVALNFADAPRSSPERQILKPEAPPTRATTIRRTGSVARPTIAVSFRAPGIDTPDDVVAMDVLLAHWNEGRDAAMRRALVGAPNEADDESSTRNDASQGETSQGETSQGETSQGETSVAPIFPALALDIAFLTQRDPSLVTFSLVSQKNQASSAVKALYGEIARVQRSAVTTSQLERAKRALRRQYLAQGETAAGQAGALGFYDMIGSYEFAATYLNRINLITLADVKRVANRYFKLSVPVAVLIQPEPVPKSAPDDTPGAEV